MLEGPCDHLFGNPTRYFNKMALLWVKFDVQATKSSTNHAIAFKYWSKEAHAEMRGGFVDPAADINV